MNNPNEKIEGQEEGNLVPVEQQENIPAQAPETSVEKVAEDPFAKGRERMASIGNFFSKAKEKFIETKHKVGASISRFWSRTKNAASTTAAAVLSADVLAKRADTWVGDKVEQAGAAIGHKAAEGVSLLGDSLEMGFDWTQGKIDQFENFVDTNWDKATEFVKNKAESVKNFANEKVELAKDVAFYAKMKTNEGLDKAKNGIKNQWGKIQAFGEGAIASAKLEAAKLKEGYRNKMNAIREARLKAEYEAAVAQESAASERAMQLKEKREALERKMGLLRGLTITTSAEAA